MMMMKAHDFDTEYGLVKSLNIYEWLKCRLNLCNWTSCLWRQRFHVLRKTHLQANHWCNPANVQWRVTECWCHREVRTSKGSSWILILDWSVVGHRELIYLLPGLIGIFTTLYLWMGIAGYLFQHVFCGLWKDGCFVWPRLLGFYIFVLLLPLPSVLQYSLVCILLNVLCIYFSSVNLKARILESGLTLILD